MLENRLHSLFVLKVWEGNMNNREIILSSIDIMESKLKSSTTIYEISSELGFSLYYFSRLFKAITGISPKSYLLARKVSHSIDALLNTNHSILDIALDYGFGSSESYTRAFFKIIRENPSDIRRRGLVDSRLLMKTISANQLKCHKHAIDKVPEIIDLGSIKLVGIPFFFDVNIKNDLTYQWELLMNNLDKIPMISEPHRFYQLQFWFPEQDTDTLYFYVAVEVNDYRDVPIQFTAKTLPAQRYLKFRHQGLSNQVNYTYQYIYEEWLPCTEYRLSSNFNFEYYGNAYLGPCNEDSISEIYIPLSDE